MHPQRALCSMMWVIVGAGYCAPFAAAGSDLETGAGASELRASAHLVISEDQLQGSWMDSETADRYTSRWTFAKPDMTFAHYSGRVTRTTYTLRGNTLVVHHAPGLMHKEPWDETIELKHYSGDTLVWDYGTLITLHRLP